MKRRPAELTASLASIVAGVLSAVFHVDNPELVAAVVFAIGHIPAAVTWFVEHRAKKELGR